MSKIVKLLDGKKSYVGIIVGAIYAILVTAGVLPNNEYVWTAIATFTGIAFRAAIK